VKSRCSQSGIARTLALVISATLLSACGSIPSDRGFRETLNQFYGASIGAVEDRFGPPDLVEKKPNGNTLYTWRKISRPVAPWYIGDYVSEPTVAKFRVYGNSVQESKASGWPDGRQWGDTNTVTDFCIFVVETSATQRVIGYEYWGNFCRVAPPASVPGAK